jgi:acetyl-CoA synthetase
VVFGGFSAQSLRDRIEDAGAVMPSSPPTNRPRRQAAAAEGIVDEALALGGCDTIKRNVIVYKRTGGNIAWNGRATAGCTRCWPASPHLRARMGGRRAPAVPALHLGSTGKPKGVQHSTGGYLLHAALTTKWTFDLKPDDVFWCTADIGWVTGHTYITYGPLALGGTEIVFEGVPTYPDAGRFWKMIQDHKVTIFYTAPTAIRSLIKAAESNEAVHPRKQRPVSSLRILGRWASRSTRPPGSGTTRTSAAAAAPSSTPSGRPRPAAT